MMWCCCDGGDDGGESVAWAWCCIWTQRISALARASCIWSWETVTTATRTVREVTADSPRGVAQIFIWMAVGPTRQSSLLPFSFQSRAELELPRHRRPLPSISLLRPPNLDFSRGNLPRHPLHLSKPLDRLLTAGILPHHRRTPLELLEALLHHRSASPVVLRSNRPREWIRGEFLVLPGLFPFRGVSPAPVNGRRRRRRTCCRLQRGSEVRYRGRSAWEVQTVRRSD